MGSLADDADKIGTLQPPNLSQDPLVLIERVDGRVNMLQAILDERDKQLEKAFNAVENARESALASYPTKEDFNRLSEQVIMLRTSTDTMAGRTTGSNAMSDLIFKIFPILISSGVLAWQIGK